MASEHTRLRISAPWILAAAVAGRAFRAPLPVIALLFTAWMPGVSLATVDFADGTFDNSDWTLTTFVYQIGSTSGTQVASGGNPGEHRTITTSPGSATGGTNVLGLHLRAGTAVDPAVDGPIVSVDYAEDYLCPSGGPIGCFGQGQGGGLAIMQGGSAFLVDRGAAGVAETWTTLTITAATQDDFDLIAPAPGVLVDTSIHPDFSAAGAPIQFGFARHNGTTGSTGYSIQAQIDNWSVSVETAPPVPAMARPGLALLVAMMLSVAYVVLAGSTSTQLQRRSAGR